MKKSFGRLRKANPVFITGIIENVINKLNLESKFFFEKLKKNWPEIVGATNARNTKPVFFKNNILTVTVASPGWLTELRFSKNKILDKINSHDVSGTLKVKDIKFSLNDYNRSSI